MKIAQKTSVFSQKMQEIEAKIGKFVKRICFFFTKRNFHLIIAVVL